MVDMTDVHHRPATDLEAEWSGRPAAPTDVGTVDLIVARPANGERAVLEQGELVVGEGLVGDNYVARGNDRTPDGAAHPEAQLNVMGSAAIDLVSGGDRSLWPLAGDQFFVDLDLSVANLPAGTRLAIGNAVIEVAQKPHTGCAKFSERFGIDAARWVNQERDERRRGLNAMVIQAGAVRTGDAIRKLT